MECPMCKGRRSCPECDGIGDVTCPDCDGLGCESCLSSGARPCPPCQGTGVCPRCKGEGAVQTQGVRDHLYEM